MEAEGLPIDSLPLEAAMALAAWEEARPLHKLSSVRILAILLKFLKKYTYLLLSPLI